MHPLTIAGLILLSFCAGWLTGAVRGYRLGRQQVIAFLLNHEHTNVN